MKLHIAAAALVVFSSSAYAADTLIEVMPGPTFNWSGAYVGLHGGYGWGSIHDINNPAAAKQDIDGGFGGIQAGYNHQFSSNIVIGVEVDASLGSIGGSYDDRDASPFSTYYTEDKVTALGTLRARLGYAANRFLPYATGGLAWGNIEHKLGCDVTRVPLTLGCSANGGNFEVSKSDTSMGWAAGGGGEYALTENWTIKAEYLFTDLGTNKVTLVDPNYPASINERNFETQFSTVRFGVNYKY